MHPSVIFFVPMYNRAATIERCILSALRQRAITVRVVVVDHGSSDDSRQIVHGLAAHHDEIDLVELVRAPDERRSPCRPLNEGLGRAIASDLPADRTWVFRLDADDFLTGDDVVAAQLSAGGYRELIMATLVFFDAEARTAYEYGPRPRNRTLTGLPGRDVYAVAHHSTGMRLDFLRTVLCDGPAYDDFLETGEDLGFTCRLVATLGDNESRFSFVPEPYCYKELAPATITGSLPLRRVWRSHRRLLRTHPELSAFAVIRGLAELGLSRVVGEGPARRSLQHIAGRNGHYEAVDFGEVAERLCALGQASPGT